MHEILPTHLHAASSYEASGDATFVWRLTSGQQIDLRDTNWAGLELFRVRFEDCKLAGAHGAPIVSETVVERADLSPAGDGSQLGGLREVCRLWGVALGAAT